MEILIAEDETDIAFMYKMLLEDRGHVVTVANDGQECLNLYYDRSNQPFDLVILDHRMTKMGGFEVAKKIVSINPNQRIIIASGYSKDIFEEAAEKFQLQVEILQKPFSRITLVDLVEKK